MFEYPVHRGDTQPANGCRHCGGSRAAYYLSHLRARYMQSGRMPEAEVNGIMARQRTPFATSLPVHTNRMHVDPSHAIWLQQFDSDDDAPARWMVVDSTIAYLGAVTTPSRFTVMEVGTDYVLGVWRDSLDVEHVRMYRLARKGGGLPSKT